MRLRGLSVGTTRRVLGVVAAVAFLCSAFMVMVHASAGAAVPFSISVSGNHLVDGSGNVIQLRGVNRSGGEYACAGYPGWGFWDGPADQTSVNAIKSWGVNAVRLPLNEACWLGIDGTGGTYGGQNYINAVVAFVNLLNANSIYVILDYQWGACGSTSVAVTSCYANWQKAMPDRPNATTFWASVGATFKNNHAVLFDLFNEPNGNSDWNCWLNGGCTQYSGGSNQYVAEGMQPMLNAVRGAGATTQPVMLGGYSYSNDFSGFMTHQPVDPSHATVLSVHLYDFNYPCANTACFDSGTYSIKPEAAIMPVVVGEFGEGTATGTFDTQVMNWADTNGYSYLAWTWDTWGCGGAVIISNYDGTPCSPNGTAIKTHYLAVANKPTTTTTTTTKPITVPTAPRSPISVAGDGQATVEWTAPASNGGASLTGYVVTPYLNGTAQTPHPFSSIATTEVILGLTNAKSYTFTVAAKNTKGTGPSSTATAPVVIGTPTAPRAPVAVPGNGQATVSWTVPLTNGGASITGYVIIPYLSGVAQNRQTFNSTTTSQIITKLANTDTYVFRIAAKNSRGTGRFSGPTTPIKVGTPTAPRTPSALAGIGRATVKWAAPVSDNGSATAGYVVTPYLSGVAQTAHAFKSVATTQVITGLTGGDKYSFRVAAWNARGVGPQSVATAPVIVQAGSVATASGATRPSDANPAGTGTGSAYQSAR